MELRQLDELDSHPVSSKNPDAISDLGGQITLDSWDDHQGRIRLLRGDRCLISEIAALRDAALGRKRKVENEGDGDSIHLRTFTSAEELRKRVEVRSGFTTEVIEEETDVRGRTRTQVWGLSLPGTGVTPSCGVDQPTLYELFQGLVDYGEVLSMAQARAAETRLAAAIPESGFAEVSL